MHDLSPDFKIHPLHNAVKHVFWKHPLVQKTVIFEVVSLIPEVGLHTLPDAVRIAFGPPLGLQTEVSEFRCLDPHQRLDFIHCMMQ